MSYTSLARLIFDILKRYTARGHIDEIFFLDKSDEIIATVYPSEGVKEIDEFDNKKGQLEESRTFLRAKLSDKRYEEGIRKESWNVLEENLYMISKIRVNSEELDDKFSIDELDKE